MNRFAVPALTTSLALLTFVAPSSAEFTELSVRMDPLQPAVGEDFTFVVAGRVDGSVQLEDVTVGPEEYGNATEVRVTLRETCPTTCSRRPFSLSVPIDASSVDFPGDDHAISVEIIDSSNEVSLPLYKRFAVGETYFGHPLPHQAFVNPSSPTENDLVRLVVTSDGNYCGPSTAELERFERVGNVVNVFLTYWAGFGGGFPSTSVAPATQKCTPPGPYSDAVLVDFGVLYAGTYRVDVYLEEEGDFGTLPIRTRRSTMTVENGADFVPLQDGRFEVFIDWRDFDNRTGVGKPVPGATDDSTLFTFFGGENWEVLVKILDACTLNGKFWVLTAAATTVEYTITIEDTLTGAVWTYDNPLGFPSPAVTDIEAFDCSP